jgi:osmotically-inducible protein OsmY
VLRGLLRAFFRGVLVLLLLAGAAAVYTYYRTGRLPYIQRVVEDAAVAASVKAAMALHRDLASRAIRVEARSGSVILRGTVGAEEEKLQATTIAESVEGVRAVENLLEVSAAPAASASRSIGQTLDDAALLAKVRAALSLDRQTKSVAVEVSVRDGTVVLEGTVPSDDVRIRVLERVQGVEGVENVDDRLSRD